MSVVALCNWSVYFNSRSFLAVVQFTTASNVMHANQWHLLHVACT